MNKKSSDEMVGETHNASASVDFLSDSQEDYVRPAGVKPFEIKKAGSELRILEFSACYFGPEFAIITKLWNGL